MPQDHQSWTLSSSLLKYSRTRPAKWYEILQIGLYVENRKRLVHNSDSLRARHTPHKVPFLVSGRASPAVTRPQQLRALLQSPLCGGEKRPQEPVEGREARDRKSRVIMGHCSTRRSDGETHMVYGQSPSKPHVTYQCEDLGLGIKAHAQSRQVVPAHHRLPLRSPVPLRKHIWLIQKNWRKGENDQYLLPSGSTCHYARGPQVVRPSKPSSAKRKYPTDTTRVHAPLPTKKLERVGGV